MENKISYCQRCQIAYINGVFHWSYGNKPTTPEKVLATVCIPTEGRGDRVDIPCLAKMLQGTSAVPATRNVIEFDLPDNEYYLKIAKEILDGH